VKLSTTAPTEPGFYWACSAPQGGKYGVSDPAPTWIGPYFGEFRAFTPGYDEDVTPTDFLWGDRIIPDAARIIVGLLGLVDRFDAESQPIFKEAEDYVASCLNSTVRDGGRICEAPRDRSGPDRT
jgi:hypothetical protein